MRFLQAGGLIDCFLLWEGEKSRHSSLPSLPCVGGRADSLYAPPQTRGHPTVNLTPHKACRENESTGDSREGGPEVIGASGPGGLPEERCTPGVGPPIVVAQ